MQKHLKLTLAVLIGLLPCSVHAAITLTEDFESSVAGSDIPPEGWSLLGTTGATPFYATSATGSGSDGSGRSTGLAGQVNSTTTPTNTEFPGAYLVSNQAFDLSYALTGSFDFLFVNEAATNDDVGFIIGAVGDGITGNSEGELLYARLTEGNNNIGGILQDGNGGATSRLDEQATTFANDIWYRAIISWLPTSGTTGNYSFEVRELNNSASKVNLTASDFTFDSAGGQIGFGSINDTIRFDNMDFTGTSYQAPPISNADLSLKVISAEPATNIDLLLSGPPSSSYFIYRSNDLEGPLYRKRWSERFADNFPSGVSEVTLSEPADTQPRGFFVATDTQPKARIMCVGDSITEGSSTYFVYRPVLNEQLAAAGYRFEFVGSKTNTMGGVTLRHEGYSGKRADQIASFLVTTFPANIADIVLIHAGHNNDATIDSETVILNRVEDATRSMVATARLHNPDVIVLLAQVITSSKLPKYSYIPALNLRLAELAAELNSAAQPVLIVNQADGWDPVADTVTDQVHPAESGAIKMANKWFAVLSPLLE